MALKSVFAFPSSKPLSAKSSARFNKRAERLLSSGVDDKKPAEKSSNTALPLLLFSPMFSFSIFFVSKSSSIFSSFRACCFDADNDLPVLVSFCMRAAMRWVNRLILISPDEVPTSVMLFKVSAVLLFVPVNSLKYRPETVIFVQSFQERSVANLPKLFVMVVFALFDVIAPCAES